MRNKHSIIRRSLVSLLNKRAFSLVEIMIATVVIVSALVPIVMAIGFGGKGTQATTREIIATSYGSSLLEYMLNQEWGDLENAWTIIRDDSDLKHEQHNELSPRLKHILGLNRYLLDPELQDNAAWSAIDKPQHEDDFGRTLMMSRHELYKMSGITRDYMRIEIRVEWKTESGQEMVSLFKGIKSQDGSS